jgi:hypothetical protein
MIKSVFVNFSVIAFIFSINLNSQTPETGTSTHEKWEFVLEDTGDILLIAYPLLRE